jgi:uncharacterized membrane protein YfcA
MRYVLAALVGAGVGFLGGALGKGGSAVATPLLHAIGFPAIVAVASPLPATIPSTMIAGYAYARERLIDWRVVRWSIAVGVPTTVLGAVLTRWISGSWLVRATEMILIGLGVRLLAARKAVPSAAVAERPSAARSAMVAGVVGVVSGLLANSGGFLLAPLFITVLRLPIQAALGSSLAVASVLAVPGTAVHAALGHVDWRLTALFGVCSVPLSFAGARVALRTDPRRLERVYGLVLVFLGAVLLAVG